MRDGGKMGACSRLDEMEMATACAQTPPSQAILFTSAEEPLEPSPPSPHLHLQPIAPDLLHLLHNSTLRPTTINLRSAARQHSSPFQLLTYAARLHHLFHLTAFISPSSPFRSLPRLHHRPSLRFPSHYPSPAAHHSSSTPATHLSGPFSIFSINPHKN
ncbi:hypothetical protein MRB53_013773 [Persea americana]|uniref:Uncharacterized protein n=1 Tax=Persea americana TaxID=3435 RepID=A0ACC2K9B9_PERAE|nr:hypothetical protein MRB53_013773 [Persea americana]